MSEGDALVAELGAAVLGSAAAEGHGPEVDPVELHGRLLQRALLARLEVTEGADLSGELPRLALAYGRLLGEGLAWDPLTGGWTRVSPRGSARKRAGAFYTPPAVVEALLDLVLEPLLDSLDESGLRALHLVDPSCGAGAFLVAAARRVARRLPGAEVDNLAAVASTALFGVDRDPVAVALCRASLRGLGGSALALEAHIAWGDALIGAPHGVEAGDADRWCASRLRVPLGELSAPPIHWWSRFPVVSAAGGFDLVIGNPPWERLKLQEQEWFALRAPAVALSPHAAARAAAIRALDVEAPALAARWRRAQALAQAEVQFVLRSGRYPLSGRGDPNGYPLFTELGQALLHPGGRAGWILPSGIATDETTRPLFAGLVRRGELRAFFDLENHAPFFPAVHRSFRFCLLSLDRRGGEAPVEMAFFLRDLQGLWDPSVRVRLPLGALGEMNPNTGTLSILRSQADAELSIRIYRRYGILLRTSDESNAAGGPWGIRTLSMFHMANDAHRFSTAAELRERGWALQGDRFVAGPEGAGRYLPLIEAKMVHLFDHRSGSFAGSQGSTLPSPSEAERQDPHHVSLPRYWVAEVEVERRLSGRWARGWLLGWRDVCRATDSRTLIAAVFPRAAVNDKLPLLLPSEEPVWALVANLSSLVLDYFVRQKVGATSLKLFVLRQLPVLPPSAYLGPCPWSPGESVADWLRPRVLELVYTGEALRPFANDLGYDGPPFRWEPERRWRLQVELDAAFFHLYGLDEPELCFVLSRFEALRSRDLRRHGRPRTEEDVRAGFRALSSLAAAR